MNSYCSAEGIDEFRQVFDDSVALEEESFKNKLWTECVVIEKHPTDEASKRYGNLLVDANDVEVIIEAKMIDPDKGNPKTKFWFLLRKFGDEWKIVGHSHIPDSNYPAYD